MSDTMYERILAVVEAFCKATPEGNPVSEAWRRELAGHIGQSLGYIDESEWERAHRLATGKSPPAISLLKLQTEDGRPLYGLHIKGLPVTGLTKEDVDCLYRLTAEVCFGPESPVG